MTDGEVVKVVKALTDALCDMRIERDMFHDGYMRLYDELHPKGDEAGDDDAES